MRKIAFSLILYVLTTVGLCNMYNAQNEQKNVFVKAPKEVIYDDMNGVIKQIYMPTIYEDTLNIPLQLYLNKKCIEYNIEYELALAIIYIESRYNYDIIGYNRNGSYDSGLFQINSINRNYLFQNIKTETLLDPYQNIEAGLFLLSQAFIGSETEHIALMKYNMGEIGAYRLIHQGIVTSVYSTKVIDKRNELLNQKKGNINE